LDVRRIQQAASAALLTALLVAPLAGCTDDTKAEPGDPTGSPSNTATTEPSPTDPSIPPEAQGEDDESAKAFIRYYFEVLSTAMVTGDTSALQGFSGDACRTCRGLIDRITNLYEKNGRVTTSGWIPEKLTRLPDDSSRTIGFLARVKVSPQRLLDEHGDLVSRTPGDLVPMRVNLTRHSRGWMVKEIENLR
jgi:hypothetical protein